MSEGDEVSFEVTREVANACLCLHLQQAARAVARRFDAALRPFGLTSGQFSLLMSLNRPKAPTPGAPTPEAPTIGTVSAFLAMDRTTLTANLKPLVRRGLAAVAIDETDRRNRRLVLTPAGRDLLGAALPAWRETQAAIEETMGAPGADRLRADLRALS